MENMLPYDIQLSNEHRFSRRHIDKYIRAEFQADEEAMSILAKGVEIYKEWVNGTYYLSKTLRLEQLQQLNPEKLVMDVIVHTAYCTKPEMFTTVSAQLANKLGFNDRKEGITTAAELLAVLCQTDLYDIIKPRATDSMLLKTRLTFSDKLNSYIEQSMYLPPMVCEPRTITTNRMSGYLTHNDSVILKGYNHHEDDVCLDVINIQNKNCFSLDIEFLRAVNEEPPSDLDEVKNTEFKTRAQIKEIIQRKKENWERFYGVSQHVYMMLVEQGNKFYFTNKYDKRLRMYTQGYHLNPQGSKYKKAMLNLANEELVEGVPT